MSSQLEILQSPVFAVFNMPPVCSPAVGEGFIQTGIHICLNKFGFIETVLDEESVPLVVSDTFIVGFVVELSLCFFAEQFVCVLFEAGFVRRI